ncbi:hypothetical protein [Limosilactobacillus fermentum]|uniref:hypothetical protein n=1 Tax=Limosilactobacillus fermentum TaxID=1613 RepID=UPI00316A86D0
MKIHTLGPAVTDSHRAAEQYRADHENLEVVGHPSFEVLYQSIPELRGELLLIPAAVKTPAGASWGDLHYQYGDRLELIDSLITELSPLAILERRGRSGQRAYCHPATIDYLTRNVEGPLEIMPCPSKWQAYRCYQTDGRYTLTSQAFAGPADRVIKTIHLKMLWSVYQVKGETDAKTSVNN